MRVHIFIITTLLILNNILKSDAAEIIYPRNNEVTINSATTFFIGNENPTKTLKINSETVKIHESGGFYHPINLEYGQNKFEIFDGYTTKTYKITRPQPKTSESMTNPITKYYSEPKLYVVKDNNSPLRSTPINFGTNRLQHLEKDTPLKIIGEQNDFYKVQLARDDYAYILKKDVIEASDNNAKIPAILQSYIYEENKNNRVFKLKLNKKVPYVLSENQGLDLVIYNVKDFPENKYEFHINPIGKLFGYKSYYNNNSELIIEVKNPPITDKTNPLKGLKITIDAGHGGKETGTIGCLGHKEKDINLILSNKLQEKLIQKGARPFMVRVDDYDIDLKSRVEASQYINSDLFISIHNNAPPDSAAFTNKSGSSVFYFYHQSKALAKSIQNSLTTELGLADDHVKAQSFAVVRNTQSPAVLIEVGYMTNPEDNSKIITPEFQDKAVDAIIHGLENYINDIQ